MVATAARGVLYVHSSPRAVCPHVEWAVGRAIGHAVTFDWEEQPVLRGAMRADYAWEGAPGTGAAIASHLRGWAHLRFEVTEEAADGIDGGRWLHTPDLGIFHAQTDAFGSVVVREDRIRAAIDAAGTNQIELIRELRLALGQDWDDELEPFRHAIGSSSVVWLHRSAV